MGKPMKLDEVMVLDDYELGWLAAEKVMGWRRGEVSTFGGPRTEWLCDGRRALYPTDWGPCDRWDHAMLLNERMRELHREGSPRTLFGEYALRIHTLTEIARRSLFPLEQFLYCVRPIDITRAAVLTMMEEEYNPKRTLV